MRRRSRRRTKYRLLPIAVALLLLGSFFLIEITLRSTIGTFALAQANWKANRAIQNAVLENVVGQVNYRDLVHVEKDNEQQVVFMQADVVAINQMAAKANLAVQDELERLGEESFSIPLGRILGSSFLANLGPHLRVEMIPVGTVKVDVEDSFENTGINQTRHRIYLKIESDLQVVIPLVEEKIKLNSTVPVADAVIVGPVPNTYLDIGDWAKGFR